MFRKFALNLFKEVLQNTIHGEENGNQVNMTPSKPINYAAPLELLFF